MTVTIFTMHMAIYQLAIVSNSLIMKYIYYRCTTESVEPLNGINKDAWGAKLLPTTVSAYPVAISVTH